jgi:hypothetical protein
MIAFRLNGQVVDMSEVAKSGFIVKSSSRGLCPRHLA